ncbi:MAG: flagellar biosynthetic protein FliR [candidate division Zixibacteria bacterium]|nr:flagellar biosynthetic protein FliR [candidate division Zixibacteria bacterium]
MFDFINLGAEKIQLFILLMMRVGGIMLTAPVFSHRAIPKKFTVSMSLGLTVVLLPIMISTPLPETANLVDLLILCFREMFVGVLIGTVFSFIFIAARLAGSIVGYQIGFSMVNVMDPNSTSPVSILGELWFLLGTLIFLIINGHHMIISGLVNSFQLIPLGMATPSADIGEWLLKYSSFVFVLAVKFAAPVMITIFLLEIAMGVLARTMPQMNIFIVGFPLKIFVGLLVFGLSLPAFSMILQKVNLGINTELMNLMKLYNVSGSI